jgi:hypothetical protein
MFICFDIFYGAPGAQLASGSADTGPIHHFVFSSYWMWVPRPPMLPAAAVQQVGCLLRSPSCSS